MYGELMNVDASNSTMEGKKDERAGLGVGADGGKKAIPNQLIK